MSVPPVSLTVLNDRPVVLSTAGNGRSGKLVALYRSADYTVAASVVPDDEVVLATFGPNDLDSDVGTFSLESYYLALSKERFPKTSGGRAVLGYQDPTMITASDNNPFSPGQLGIMASQLYRRSFGRVGTNLVYYDSPTDSLRDVLTSDGLRQLGIRKATAAVKEGELLIASAPPEPSALIFQYSVLNSNIGIGLIEAGKVTTAVPFRTAAEDGSTHVSPAGAPVKLENGNLLLLYNRCRNSECGVAYMVLDPNVDAIPAITHVSSDFIIRVDPKQVHGWRDALRAFASSVTLQADGTIEVLYDVNGDSCRRAVLQVSQ